MFEKIYASEEYYATKGGGMSYRGKIEATDKLLDAKERVTVAPVGELSQNVEDNMNENNTYLE